jgi:hypothetical protein
MKVPRIALLLFSAQLLAQDRAPASVEGTAIVAVRTNLWRGAVVELKWNGAGAVEPLFAATQTDGRFLFRAVPAANISLSRRETVFTCGSRAAQPRTPRGSHSTGPRQQVTGCEWQ